MTQLFNKTSELAKRRRLRKKQLAGVRFRRQYSIGAYVVDFYSPEKKLAIELDGSQHFEEKTMEYDRKRTEYIASAGIKTIRFTNNEVFKNLEGVLQKIANSVDECGAGN